MTDIMERKGGFMKNENLLLNAVCIVMALLFLGLAGLNFFSAGNFISTDSLFFTTVSGMMALIFLLVPLTSLMAARKARKTPAGGAAAASAAATAGRGGALAGATRTASGAVLSPVRYADAVDARGRRIPPDVAMMVELMKDREA
jgi:hypothetical protein